MKIIQMPLSDLVPYENNPRINDHAVDAVASSIREFGFKVPIIVDKENVIVAGHTRLKAALRLGLDTVPVIIADDLTPEQVKAFRLADNKTAEMAYFDIGKLQIELAGIEDIDMAEFGFDLELDTLNLSSESEAEPEYVVPAEPKSKYGDIYRLENHVLMCGDSTSEVDVGRLLNGAIVDLLLTDPPYNVDYVGNGGRTMANDAMDDGEYLEFLQSAFTNAARHLAEGGVYYIFHDDTKSLLVRTAVNLAGLEVRQCLVWVKNTFAMGRQDYHWRHESILYGWKDGAAHYFIDDRTQDTVLEEDRPQRNDIHPTMKPVPLIKKLIANSSRTGDVVLDLFGGSGTTLIACEEMKRKCYMMEYDPRYVDAIINRWSALTGLEAQLL
jgi:site-specific DNA-methyltransferase (adenine-specific)